MAVFDGKSSKVGFGFASMVKGSAIAAGVANGTIAVARCNIVGGSRPVKDQGLQVFHKGSTSKTFDGNAMMGRYGSPGSGLYH